jgi:hypothetical protein
MCLAVKCVLRATILVRVLLHVPPAQQAAIHHLRCMDPAKLAMRANTRARKDRRRVTPVEQAPTNRTPANLPATLAPAALIPAEEQLVVPVVVVVPIAAPVLRAVRAALRGSGQNRVVALRGAVTAGRALTPQQGLLVVASADRGFIRIVLGPPTAYNVRRGATAQGLEPPRALPVPRAV